MSEDIVDRLTQAVRVADRQFEETGGTTRHYINECLLSALEKYGLELVLAFAVLEKKNAYSPTKEGKIYS